MLMYVNTCIAGRDLIGVQNLMKKHQALQAELAGHEPRIQNVCATGQNMIKEGHFAHDTISAKIKDLQDRWQQLKVQRQWAVGWGWRGYHLSLGGFGCT